MKYLATILCFAFFCCTASAQFGIPEALKKKAEEEVEKAINKEEEAPKEEDKKAEEKKEDAPKEATDIKTPEFKVYSKYDFIPGEQTLFFEDFSSDNVGDFPARWNTNGSGEVVTSDNVGGKWLQLKSYGFFIPDYNTDFPQNYTIEFDFIPMPTSDFNFSTGFYLVRGNIKKPDEGGAIPGTAGCKITFSKSDLDYSSYDNSDYTTHGSNKCEMELHGKYRVSIWVQNQRLRIYVNGSKIIDAPRALPKDAAFNMIRLENSDAETNPLYTNIRIAAAAPDTRSKLITEGKLVTHGITFAVASDKLKPESFGVLKSIAQALTENPTVKINIIGHTDSDGNAEKNLELSKKRAESVKRSLVEDFKIDASRIATDGKGASEPLKPNDSAENKAENRRVELIKL